MKKKFTFLMMSFVVIFSIFTNISTQAQNQDYFREGFEGGTITSIASPTTAVPIYAIASNSGEWYLFGTYRTTGTGCAANGTLGHIRWKSAAATLPDSPYLVTPSVNFGIKELHLQRSRAGRNFSIWTREDTSAQATTGWTQVAYIVSSPNICTDTTIMINSASAKRLRIMGRQNADSDIDSIWITSFNVIVPIIFNGINASQINDQVKINWNIVTEVNTLRYDIERSFDGRNFTTVGNVNATNAGKYSFIDNAPAAGDNFYRIKGVDKDGKITLSSVVRINSNKKSPELTLLPNPVVNGKLNIQLSNFEKGIYSISLFTNAGQKVFSNTINNEAGSSSQTLELPAVVQPGVYKMVLVNGSTKTSKTVIIQ